MPIYGSVLGGSYLGARALTVAVAPGAVFSNSYVVVLQHFTDTNDTSLLHAIIPFSGTALGQYVCRNIDVPPDLNGAHGLVTVGATVIFNNKLGSPTACTDTINGGDIGATSWDWVWTRSDRHSLSKTSGIGMTIPFGKTADIVMLPATAGVLVW